MNLENVVLVRAMSHLPLDGVLLPSCEGKYLVPNEQNEYYYYIRGQVKKKLESDLGRSLDVWNEEDNLILNNALKSYLPLTSAYTSTLSFSLNGLVPDDINNKFSEMKIAVLDPIKYHQNEDYVNIDAIDTTIKGSIISSKEAILVIEKDYFLSLSEEEKTNLMSHYKVELFTGSLKDAVSSTLQKYNYPSLPLIQKKDISDIEECAEKESMIDFQQSFAQLTNASRLKLQQLYMYPISTMSGVDAVAAEKVQSDFNKNLIVEKYYKEKLYGYLVSISEKYGLVLDEEEKFYLFSEFSNSEEVLRKIIDFLIQNKGIESISVIIQEYNEYIIKNHITNDEIVSLNGDSRK